MTKHLCVCKYFHRILDAKGKSHGSQPVGDLVINPTVGCHYFLPDEQLPSQRKSVTAPGRCQIVLPFDRGT